MWQTVLVMGVVALAAAYVGRRLWRSLAKPETAACGCGCSGAPGGCPLSNGAPSPVQPPSPGAPCGSPAEKEQ